MKIQSTLLLVTAAFLLSMAHADDNQFIRVRSEPVEGLRITLELPTARFEHWERKSAVAVLTNVGDEPLVIHPHLCTINVGGKGAKRLYLPRMCCRMPYPLPETLDPGRSKRIEFPGLRDSTYSHWTLEVGTYKFTASYIYPADDGHFTARTTKLSGRLWANTVVTPAVDVRVVPDSPAYTSLMRLSQSSKQVLREVEGQNSLRSLAKKHANTEEVLIRLSTAHSESGARLFAIQALGLLRSRAAVPTLLALIDVENVQYRMGAVDALLEIGDPRATTAACKMVDWAPYFILPRLANFGDKRAIPTLERYAKLTNPSKSGIALAGLQKLTGVDHARRLAREYVRTGDIPTCSRLDAMGPTGYEAALEAFEKCEDPDWARHLVDICLKAYRAGYLRERITQVAVAAYESSDRHRRRVAARLIHNLRNRTTAEAMLRRLAGPDQTRSMAAASVLGNRKEKWTVQPLLKCLRGTDPKAAGAAVVALARFRSPELEKAILAQYPDVDPYVQSTCLGVMPHYGGETTRAWLKDLSENATDLTTRRKATRGLKTMDDRNSPKRSQL